MNLPPKEITAAGVRVKDERIWILWLIVILTFLTFSRALLNGFVSWDDAFNFLLNPHYRGLGFDNIRWMWTSAHSSHYIPLSWMTLGFDYFLWGMNPKGYHLTNLILHAVNAALFYGIARRLIFAASPDAAPSRLTLAAAAGALFFAVHPLRVESVAWITERRDVLSGFFYLLSVFSYLKAVKNVRSSWLYISMIAFSAALLSKSIVMTLPITLLILDIYPLKRFGTPLKTWFSRQYWPVWREKLYFAALAASAGVTAFWIVHRDTITVSWDQHPFSHRLAQFVFALAFYLLKTICPFRLSPLYPFWENFYPFHGIILLSALVIAGLAVVFWAVRRRWPVIIAAACHYVVAVAPVSGLVHIGPQTAADRYTYVSCLGWALVFGAAGSIAWKTLANRHANRLRFIVPLLIGTWLFVLASLSWSQTKIWKDSLSLWSHALKLNPHNMYARLYLGLALEEDAKKPEEALFHFQLAAKERPNHPRPRMYIGNLLSRLGRKEEALVELRAAEALEPRNIRVLYNLGILLADTGRTEEAIEVYSRILTIDPRHEQVHNNLANLLLEQGRDQDALTHYLLALGSDPWNSTALMNMGRYRFVQGKLEDAESLLRKALRIDPEQVDARTHLGHVLLSKGRSAEAVREYREVVRRRPDSADALNNLGAGLWRMGNENDARISFQRALTLNPRHEEARANLARLDRRKR